MYSKHPDNTNYPFCIYPSIIDEWYNDPSVLFTKPKKPIEPKKPQELDFPYPVFIFLIISVISVFKNWEVVGWSCFVLFILILIVYAIYKDKNSKELAYFPNKLEDYKKELISYENKLTEFDEHAKLHGMSACYGATMNHFKNANKPNHEEEARKGRTEVYFYQILKEIFPTVYVNKAIKLIVDPEYELSGQRSFYVPDVILVIDDIHIDIEIDEPYDMIEKNELFHCFGNTRDNNRDEFFVDQGWLVFRFAEQQIIENPHGCIRFIINFLESKIDHILDSKIIEASNKHPFARLKKVPRWKSSDTHLIQERYRESYLKK